MGEWRLHQFELLRFAVLAGILAALTLTAISSIRLRAQGLEYDELHQAPAAFAYVGRDPTMFTRVKLGRIPVLNMSYFGAIKSALYGLYMRATSMGFVFMRVNLPAPFGPRHR